MRKKKGLKERTISIFLSVLLVMGLMPAMPECVKAEAAGDLNTTVDEKSVTLRDTDGDSYYEIGTVDELYAFAKLVNAGNNEINGELTADIVVNQNVLTEAGELNEAESSNFKEWTPIGTHVTVFRGNFDGAGYTISGLYCLDILYASFIGYAIDTTVRNLGVLDSYFKGDYAGAVVGRIYGTVEKCYSVSRVKGFDGSSSARAGGVVGYLHNESLVSNCYNLGKVSAEGPAGGIVGQATGMAGGSLPSVTGAAKVEHCYNIGTIESVIGANGGIIGRIFGSVSEGLYEIENCYYLDNVSNAAFTLEIIGNETIIQGIVDVKGSVEHKTMQQFASGEVAYLLNGSVDNGTTWYQTLSGENVQTYPQFHGDKVVKCADSYSNGHIYGYKGVENTIRYGCLADGCTLVEEGSVTIAAPERAVYTGLAFEAVVTNDLITDEEITVVYTAKEGFVLTNGKPVKAGNYIASITSKGVTIGVEYTIAKATPNLGTVTANEIFDSQSISDIVLKRTNTEVAGTLTIDAGQSVVVGTNELSYTFTPTDTTNYNVVTGKVMVEVKESSSGVAPDSSAPMPEPAPEPAPTPDTEEGTWVQDGGNWYYVDEDGTKETGWVDDDGTWYYMDESGVMQTGWEYVDNTWYYMDKSGAMQTGWVLDKGTWYYMDKSGAMQTGWVLDKGTWYYMDKSGAMQTGWVLDKGTWYYMNGSGAMQTGWEYVDNTWYYMNESGAMQTGWVLDGNTWYYMNESGAMLTGWVYYKNDWYYMNPSGAMATGWVLDKGTWYYLDDDGEMVTGRQRIGGKTYRFNKSGAWIG